MACELDGVCTIVQARMASTRLPKKVMQLVVGMPMILLQLERLKYSKYGRMPVIATSDDDTDDLLSDLLIESGYPVYRGSHDDVLDRYYQAAKSYSPNHIVRITADCPLLDPEIVDKVVTHHIETGADYTSNTCPPTYPDGLDVEVFKYSILCTMWEKAKLKSEREHVTLYIKNNWADFNCKNVSSSEDHSSLRWTVDEERDLEFVREIYSNLYSGNRLFLTKSILELIKDKPHISDINQGICRDEGLRESLEQESLQ